jgi:hypothetical protein
MEILLLFRKHFFWLYPWVESGKKSIPFVPGKKNEIRYYSIEKTDWVSGGHFSDYVEKMRIYLSSKDKTASPPSVSILTPQNGMLKNHMLYFYFKKIEAIDDSMVYYIRSLEVAPRDDQKTWIPKEE